MLESSVALVWEIRISPLRLGEKVLAGRASHSAGRLLEPCCLFCHSIGEVVHRGVVDHGEH